MKKSKTGILYIILICIVAAAALAVLVLGLLGRTTYKNVAPAPTSELQIKEVEKIVEKEVLVEVEKEITTEIIQQGINDMGVLLAEEYYFTEVVSFSSIKKFLSTNIELPFTESAYLASYDGVVTAGIDFTEVKVEKNEDKKLITVTMPEAKIQNVDIDPKSFELYSEKVGLGNPLSVEDFNSSLVELEETASEKAVEMGILERADKNAETMINNLVRSFLDGSGYTVEFVR